MTEADASTPVPATDPASAAIAATAQAPTTERAQALRQQLVRNWLDSTLEPNRRAPLYDSQFASLSAGTVARKLGASFDIVAPGARVCPYHLHHVQEEMFVILEGQGTLRVAGELVPIRAGDVIFIPPGPEYPHHILNTSDAPMKYLSISTLEKPELCEYPDSAKVAMFGAGVRLVQRREASLDYWDGEG